jgi:hypothetical protein
VDGVRFLVGGNGTYKPFESTCDIKLLLPIVQS